MGRPGQTEVKIFGHVVRVKLMKAKTLFWPSLAKNRCGLVKCSGDIIDTVTEDKNDSDIQEFTADNLQELTVILPEQYFDDSSEEEEECIDMLFRDKNADFLDEEDVVVDEEQNYD